MEALEAAGKIYKIFLFIYFALCFICGIISKSKNWGFLFGFISSAFFSPLVGLFVLSTTSPMKEENQFWWQKL